jgi:hypothetical protein
MSRFVRLTLALQSVLVLGTVVGFALAAYLGLIADAEIDVLWYFMGGQMTGTTVLMVFLLLTREGPDRV